MDRRKAVRLQSRAGGKTQIRDRFLSMRSAVSTNCPAFIRQVFSAVMSAAAAMILPTSTAPCRAETMSGALARAYAANPDLNQRRAGVRAADEDLPRASSAWRPTATATGQYGFNFLDFRTSGAAALRGR